MRIISNFHDYYDSAMGQGIDQTVVYERRTDHIAGCQDDLGLDEGKMPGGDSFFDNKEKCFLSNYRFSSGLVLFCGQTHPFMTMDYLSYGIPTAKPTVHFRSFDEFDAAVAGFPEAIQRRYSRGFSDFDHFTRSQIRDFFAHRLAPDAACEILHRHQAPVVHYKRLMAHPFIETVRNPVLKDLKFFQVKDAFAAFQDISMFVSGVLRSKESAMVGISDADRVAKHGFDKWSFRKKVR